MKSTLLFPLSLSLLWANYAGAVLVNSTFDDKSPAIVYEPASSWFSNVTQECPQCPPPDEAMGDTYHYGSHIVGPDADDTNPSDTAVTSSGSPDPDAGPHDDQNGKPDGDEHGGDGDKGKGGDHKRRLQRRADADDPNFVDTPVNATLTFNGTGVYVYCIVPTQANNNMTNHLISNMSFSLNGEVVHHFVLTPPNGSGLPQYNFSQIVFQRSNLSSAQTHTLVISPLLNSMIMLDSITVTADTDDIPSPSSASGATSSNSSGSDPKKTSSKKNVETFAIAIGSTTGVLAFLSFFVALSIYLRRRRSARREKLREAQEESLRPEMRGPQPFIPRYFPGTVTSQSIPSTAPTNSMNSSSVSRRSSQSSLGPSHGLNYPIAPDVPAYTPSTAIAEIPRPLPVSVALRPPVARLPEEDDVVPPSYQEVGQTTLLSLPVFGAPPAPSFSNLSPTRHPLILSSDANTLEDDSEPASLSSLSPISRTSQIPLILEDNALLGQEGGGPSLIRRITRTNTGNSTESPT